VTYTSADAEKMGHYRNAKMDYLVVLIHPGFIHSFEFAPDAFDLPPFTNRHDPLLQSVLWSLAWGIRNGAAGLPSVYAEHAAGLLMAHLIHSMRRGGSRSPARTGLSEPSRRRVIDFIEEKLGQDISLAALAALTGTGVDVFARNFKAHMGIPPYCYVLQRRLRRAQTLLAVSEKSIAEIAFEVGFSSHEDESSCLPLASPGLMPQFDGELL
jgi:AraC family transcriptional regulator